MFSEKLTRSARRARVAAATTLTWDVVPAAARAAARRPTRYPPSWMSSIAARSATTSGSSGPAER